MSCWTIVRFHWSVIKMVYLISLIQKIRRHALFILFTCIHYECMKSMHRKIKHQNEINFDWISFHSFDSNMDCMRVNYCVEQREQQREIMRSRIFSFSFSHCFGEVPLFWMRCVGTRCACGMQNCWKFVRAQQPNNGTNIYKNKIIIASTQHRISIMVFACIAMLFSENVLKDAGIQQISCAQLTISLICMTTN